MFIRSTLSQRGFSLIELLVVVGMIGILAAFSFVAFNTSRSRSRDTQRVAYVKQISDAMEIFYLHHGYYPSAITPGQVLASGNTTYLNPVPSNPSPRTDGNCLDKNFSYSTQLDNAFYSLGFCLGAATGSYSAGMNSCANGTSCVSGLVGWWKLDEGKGVTTADSSGFANHCTFVGSPTWLTSASCKKGTCLNLNGSSYVSCGSDSSMNYGTGLTLMGWVKHTVLDTGPYVVIAKDNNRYVLETYASGFIYGTINGENWIGTLSPVIPNTDWHHIAISHNAATNAVVIYLNGAVARTTTGAWTPNNVGTVNIGTRNGGFNWNGSLDDIRVYNRALTGTEVTTIYNETR